MATHGAPGENTSAAARDPYDWAWREYELCQNSIEKYDDHLFRIRQWTIGLTAASLAAMLGLAQGGEFRPSLALLAYTAVCMTFWLLDALNKSLQTVHIHNSRDIEQFLRGNLANYPGPSTTLRFQRKEKRHLVATVKNLTDETVMLFHMLPLCLFWAVVVAKYWNRLCFGLHCSSPGARRYSALALLGVLGFMLLESRWWRSGPRHTSWLLPGGKFFARKKAALRREAYKELFLEINGRDTCDCQDERKPCECNFDYQPLVQPPFRADFVNPKNGVLLFVDRYKVSRDVRYIWERQQYFSALGLQALSIFWNPKSKRPEIIEARGNLELLTKKFRDLKPLEGYHELALGKAKSHFFIRNAHPLPQAPIESVGSEQSSASTSVSCQLKDNPSAASTD